MSAILPQTKGEGSKEFVITVPTNTSTLDYGNFVNTINSSTYTWFYLVSNASNGKHFLIIHKSDLTSIGINTQIYIDQTGSSNVDSSLYRLSTGYIYSINWSTDIYGIKF